MSRIEAVKNQIKWVHERQVRMQAYVDKMTEGRDRDIAADRAAVEKAYEDSLQSIVDKYSDDSSSVTA